MSDLLGGTCWIGEHPGDGSDVAHLLLHRTTTVELGAVVKLAALASMWGMTDATASEPSPASTLWVDTDARVLHQPGMTIDVDASGDWWAAAVAHRLVVVSLTSRPLSTPGLREVNELMGTAMPDELWCAFAHVTSGSPFTPPYGGAIVDVSAGEEPRAETTRENTMSTITAQLTFINDGPHLVDPDDWAGRSTFYDTVTLTDSATGQTLGEVRVEASEDREPYEAAIRSVIGDQPFTWVE